MPRQARVRRRRAPSARGSRGSPRPSGRRGRRRGRCSPGRGRPRGSRKRSSSSSGRWRRDRRTRHGPIVSLPRCANSARERRSQRCDRRLGLVAVRRVTGVGDDRHRDERVRGDHLVRETPGEDRVDRRIGPDDVGRHVGGPRHPLARPTARSGRSSARRPTGSPAAPRAPSARCRARASADDRGAPPPAVGSANDASWLSRTTCPVVVAQVDRRVDEDRAAGSSRDRRCGDRRGRPAERMADHEVPGSAVAGRASRRGRRRTRRSSSRGRAARCRARADRRPSAYQPSSASATP